VINKHFNKDAEVELELPSHSGAAKLYRLIAPSIEAKDHVTLAGSSVADDGTWLPGEPETVPISQGHLQFPVAHASAVLIKIARP